MIMHLYVYLHSHIYIYIFVYIVLYRNNPYLHFCSVISIDLRSKEGGKLSLAVSKWLVKESLSSGFSRNTRRSIGGKGSRCRRLPWLIRWILQLVPGNPFWERILQVPSPSQKGTVVKMMNFRKNPVWWHMCDGFWGVGWTYQKRAFVKLEVSWGFQLEYRSWRVVWEMSLKPAYAGGQHRRFSG